METKRIFLLAIASIVVLFTTATSCTKTTESQQEAKVTKTLPEGDVELIYEQGTHPRLEGLVNDSIPCTMIWDTGMAENIFVVSDSLEGMYGDSVTVQIGKFKKKLEVIYHNERRMFQYGMFQNDGSKLNAFIGKDFFEGKIIEVSLSENYLREVQDLDAVKDEYTRIKIQKYLHLNLQTIVYTQGKEIDAYVFIDTGNPGFLILNYRSAVDHGINLDSAVYREAQTVTEDAPIYHGTIMDSIRLEDVYTAIGDYKVAFMKYPNEKAMIGMLGCGVLDDFVFILDQINYDLYLKPILP